jgi:large subunit ribosomal protein L31
LDRTLSYCTICAGETETHPTTYKEVLMKTDIHPDYNPVVFRDLASGATFLTRSTVTSSKTMEWEDGNVYPVIDVEISSESHPFYTGKQRIMDSAGRVEKFNQRFKGFGA